MPEIVIDANATGEIVEMTHSQKPGTGVDLGDPAAEWIFKLLGNDFRLCRIFDRRNPTDDPRMFHMDL